MTTPLQAHAPAYSLLLRRWRQLCDKRDDKGLTPKEAKELERVNEQLGAAELQYDRAQGEGDDETAAANWRMIAEDFEEQMRYGDFSGVEG